MTKKAWALTLIIGQVFLWTGSAFMSVLYRLYDLYEPDRVTLFTEVLYYVAQAAGIALYALWLKRRPGFAGGRLCAAVCLAATALLTLGALLAPGGAVMVLGLFMNLGVGLLSGVYLTRLAAHVPQQCRGRAFGYSYAMGTAGTWLLSLPFGGALLRGGPAVWVFLVLAALSVYLTRHIEPVDLDGPAKVPAPAAEKGLLTAALALPLLCSAANGLGYYFDAADISGLLDPVFTRLFYAVGLIAAGVINDRNRRHGAIACLTALLFPFVGLALRNEPGISVFLSLFSYIFYGFFSVYRVVLFTDLAGRRRELLPLAVFGLMTGRLGDAAGTLGGMAMGKSPVLLTCATAAVFAGCVLVFFAVYHRLYVPKLTDRERQTAMLNAFEARYGFTARQSEIFRRVVDGASNAEISAALFLSERTVKFHMTNILSRTGCSNRTELLALFKSGSV